MGIRDQASEPGIHDICCARIVLGGKRVIGGVLEMTVIAIPGHRATVNIDARIHPALSQLFLQEGREQGMKTKPALFGIEAADEQSRPLKKQQDLL